MFQEIVRSYPTETLENLRSLYKAYKSSNENSFNSFYRKQWIKKRVQITLELIYGFPWKENYEIDYNLSIIENVKRFLTP